LFFYNYSDASVICLITHIPGSRSLV